VKKRRYKKKILNLSLMKIPFRAAQNKQRGRQFDMPGLKSHFSLGLIRVKIVFES